MTTVSPFDRPYQPKDIEQKWYQVWLSKGYFKAETSAKKKPYVIIMPPPNITGSLHQGHALAYYIQDCLVRWKRMLGHNVLWLPGSDHAGIATQNVVEREMTKEGLSRHKLGREKFIERVWQWREHYGHRILEQLHRFGASCDWSRERFTLDEHSSKAVTEAFVSLYQEKLIYRGSFLINWCPRCESALSDLEVEHEEKKGKLWQIQYALADEPGQVVVATTRPETLLGDTAVAVHPEDERYRSLIGKFVILPLLHRKIPILGDVSVDPAFGSGVVKITPAHDFNDFEVGQRHHLEMISIFDEKAHLTREAGPYQGLERFKARKQILQDLQKEGLLMAEQEHLFAQGLCQRCQTLVEPRLSLQWFVKTKPLAAPALRAVQSGEVKIIPEGWGKTYFHWMENIKDWCISRQIWWGHRIPAWYCSEQHTTVSSEAPKRCSVCKSQSLKQDEDVLDTWFSSALWPFSTLGWPRQTKELKLFYPSHVLETGFDILFFWVARMMMMGIHFMKEPPFHEIFLHAMVRDAEGQKMSKTKGNVMDPLDSIETYGSDALRFTHLSLACQGRDVKLSNDRIEGYRNFMNKMWNAARFVLMNFPKETKFSTDFDSSELPVVHQWILTRLQETILETRRSLEEYRLNEACFTVYHFAWSEFCDWYIELSKSHLNAEVLWYTFRELIKLLHPFMPFITEEIWQHLPDKEVESVMMASYPKANSAHVHAMAKKEMEAMMAIVSYIRTVRAEHQVKPSKTIPAVIVVSNKSIFSLLEREKSTMIHLAKLSEFSLSLKAVDTKNYVVGTVGFADVLLPMRELFDVENEKKRLQKELQKIVQELEHIEQKLAQSSFIEKAPKEVVEKEKQRAQELKLRKQQVGNNLEKICSG
ncbi:MAG: valine--tRNA ligase [Deltaproteobacteria bacterium]|nr:valine--tRNA ligase [Deltaproteobacteria bacterium]